MISGLTRMRPWMRFTLIAAGLSLAVTIAVHVYDCHVGTHEACLMSRGLLWVYWIAFFVIIGVPIAAVIEAIRHALRKVREYDA